MMSILKPNPVISRSLVITVAFIVIVLSCSKSKTNPSSKSSVKYCASINWSNTDGQSGTFTGSAINGTYALVYVQYNENGNVSGFPLHYDSNNHLISDQTGVTYAYTQDNLTQITLQGRTGAGTYNFDTNGHFTNGLINIVNGETSGTVTGTYTYDSNEDPIKISGIGTLSTPQGPMTSDIEITGDFLLDKTSLLPFIPVFAPATSYFSLVPFLSKHLLNKWVVTINGTIHGIVVPQQTLTIQYTYTYATNGNIATMVNTGNSSNIYAFVYSDCPK